MKLKIFAIYDSKIKDFANPFYLHHEGEAIRGFTEIVNDPSTKLNKYPEDFALFELGTYESTTAHFENLITPKSLITALAAKGNVNVI